MLDRLHDLPDLVILPLIVMVVAAVAVLAPFVGAYILRVPGRTGRDQAAFSAYKVIMAMAAAVLALSLVQASLNLRSAEAIVAREAVDIGSVDRILLRLDSTAAASVRPLLEAYGQSRVDDEWPGLARYHRSTVTDERYQALVRKAAEIEPATPRQQAMYAELLWALDEMAEARELMLEDSNTQLPGIFWIVAGGFLVLGLGLAVMIVPTRGRAVTLGGAAAGVGLLLAFVVIVDQPYKGETSVSPAPIEKALSLNLRRH